MKLDEEKVNELIKGMGISQAELARRAGIDRFNLNKYLKGRVCPRKVLMNVADCLDVDYLDIVKFTIY